MKEQKYLHVNGCPLCEYFTTDKLKDEEVYYIHSDFIIIKCKHCGRPLVILRNHISRSVDIPTSTWGWILKACYKQFGSGVTLITSNKGDKKRIKDIKRCHLPEDHFSCHVDVPKEYK